MVVGGCRPYELLQNDNTKIRNVVAGAFRISVNGRGGHPDFLQ
jgi:hypothetical protein